MEKKGKVEKKRGRPRKSLTVDKEKDLTSNIVDENSNETEATEMGKRRKVTKRVSKQTWKIKNKQELTSNSVVDDNVNVNASSSSSPGTASAKKAAPDTPSTIPLQNNDGNPSTLMVVMQALFGSNRADKANHVPVEGLPSYPPVQAKDAHSPNESICSDKFAEAQNDTTPSSKIKLPRKNMLDLEKFTSDLLAQTPQPESSIQVASHCSDGIMVNNNLPEREANVCSNIFMNEPDDTAKGTSQISQNPTTSTPTRSLPMDDKSEPGTEDSFVNVEGYKVKKEVMPLLKAIFSKYGDIVKESIFSMESRSCLLELVCSIYHRLEASNIKQLTPFELKSMLDQIGDLEIVKVDVGWLHRRLDQISKAQQMYEGVSTFEDVKARNLLLITEKQKTVQIREEEYEACKAAASKLKEEAQQAKDELSAAQSFADEINNIYDGSLVQGLV